MRHENASSSTQLELLALWSQRVTQSEVRALRAHSLCSRWIACLNVVLVILALHVVLLVTFVTVNFRGFEKL